MGRLLLLVAKGYLLDQGLSGVLQFPGIYKNQENKTLLGNIVLSWTAKVPHRCTLFCMGATSIYL